MAKNKPAEEKQELRPEDPEFLPVQYSLTEEKLAQLTDEYNPDLIPQADKKGDDGYQVIHEKTMAITKVRTNIEKVRKDLKADALEWGRKVDGEAKRLTAIVVALEQPWRELKEDLDTKEEREREEARIAEQRRLEEIEERIAGIKSLAEGLLGADAVAIQKRIDELMAISVTEELFGDYVEAAILTGDIIKKTLDSALAERKAFEQQQAEQAEQQAKLDAQAAEQAKQQRKLDEQKAAQEAAEAAERARKEKEEREAQEAKEREEREARRREEEEQAKAELAARLPEDIKLREYGNALLSVPTPDIENGKLNGVLHEASNRLAGIARYIHDNTQEKR